MELLKDTADNYYDLAIVDPPYGIGVDGQKKSTSMHGGRRQKVFKGWDSKTPDKIYFDEIFRVSNNQIIWGANYFTKYLPSSMGWVFWDKGQRICNSDGELAYTSFQKALRVYELNRVFITEYGDTKHPTQKPVKLYEWLLKNYAKPNDKIIDTHGGSMSIALAVHNMNSKDGMNLSLDLCELDKDYFDAGVKRYQNHISQKTIFDI